MTKDDIIKKVKSLNLNKDSYVVFGSCPLAALGIREAGDIDMVVSQEVYEKLAAAGWKKNYKGSNDEPLVHDCFDVHTHWNFSTHNFSFDELRGRAMEIEGVLFASLDDVKKWKAASKPSPKNVRDLKLIEEYLAKVTEK